MSKRATLEIQPVHDLGDGVKQIVVDCDHGTTQLAWATPDSPEMVVFNDQQLVAIALARHFDEERCACTLDLRRRYGVAWDDLT